MKTILFIIVIIVLSYSLISAQNPNIMRVHTTTGDVDYIIVDIDSITFIEGDYITFQPQDGKDARLRAANPDDNYGDVEILETGIQVAGDSRGLIEFDLTSLPYPAKQVTLKLYNTFGSGHDTTGTTKIYQVTEEWQEDVVTWNNQPSFLSENSASAFMRNEDGWVAFDITSLYQDWKSGTLNYGIMIDTDGYAYPPGKYYSSDYTEESLKPLLEIIY